MAKKQKIHASLPAKANKAKSPAQSKAAAHETAAPGKGSSMAPPSLQLKAKTGTAQRSPAKDAEGKTIAAAKWAATLHGAMDRLGTDEAAIFKTLLPLTRSQIKRLKRVYKGVYGKELIEHLRDELTDAEMTTALIYCFYWPSEGSVLGSHQTQKAKDRLLKMPGYAIRIFTDMLDFLNYKQRGYLFKALAAGNDILQLIPFGYRIKGKDDAWLQNKLHLVDSTTNRGIQQQWRMSCNATVTQAVQGELDPIYALKLHDENPNYDQVDNSDGTKKNPKMAAEQKALLESTYKGSVSGSKGNKGQATPIDTAGKGRWADDILTSRNKKAGVSFKTKLYKDGKTDWSDAIKLIDAGLAKGIPVPIVIGSSTAKYAHYVLVKSKSGSGAGTKYTIHNVGDGKTSEEPLSALKNGNLTKFGSYDRIWAVEVVKTK